MRRPIADFWRDLILFYHEEDLSYIFKNFLWTYSPLISHNEWGLIRGHQSVSGRKKE